jgi:hypothetical protein
MNASHKTAVASIKGSFNAHCFAAGLRCSLASLEKTEPEASSPDELTSALAAQLQLAIAALDTKQPEAAVGQFLFDDLVIGY